MDCKETVLIFQMTFTACISSAWQEGAQLQQLDFWRLGNVPVRSWESPRSHLRQCWAACVRWVKNRPRHTQRSTLKMRNQSLLAWTKRMKKKKRRKIMFAWWNSKCFQTLHSFQGWLFFSDLECVSWVTLSFLSLRSHIWAKPTEEGPGTQDRPSGDRVSTQRSPKANLHLEQRHRAAFQLYKVRRNICQCGAWPNRES